MVFDASGYSMARLNAYSDQIRTFTNKYDCSKLDDKISTDDNCSELNSLKNKYINLFLKNTQREFSESAQNSFDEKKSNFERQLRNAYSRVYCIKLDIDVETKEREAKRRKWFTETLSSVYTSNDVSNATIQTELFIKNAKLYFSTQASIGSMNHNIFQDIEEEIKKVIDNRSLSCAHVWLAPQDSIFFLQKTTRDSRVHYSSNEAERDRDILRRHIAYRSLLHNQNQVTDQCNATLAWTSDAKKIILFLWDSNEVFDIIHKINILRKNENGNTVRNMANKKNNLLHRDYAETMLEFLNATKTEAQQNGIKAIFQYAKVNGPVVLMLKREIRSADNVFDSEEDMMQIHFVPIPKYIFLPRQKSILSDWIFSRHFELKEMQECELGDDKTYDYCKVLKEQYKMFDFVVTQLRSYSDTFNLLSSVWFQKFLTLIGIKKFDIECSDSFDSFQVDNAHLLLDHTYPAAMGPSRMDFS